MVRGTAGLRKKLKNEANWRGISLNTLCQDFFDQALGQAGGAGATPWTGLIERIRSEFGKVLVGIVLFGSEARGEATPSSDIDLLLVLKSSVELDREFYLRWDRAFQNKEDRRFSPHFSRLPLEVSAVGSLWLEAALDGILLWGHRREVSHFLSNLRHAMVEGMFQRKTVKGQAYWVRNDNEK